MQRYVSFIVIAMLSTLCANAQKKDTAYVRTFGGLAKDVCNDIITTNDNGLIMVGSTSSFGNGTSSFYIIKTDSNGTKKWSATYGGDNIDVATAVKQTKDKGYIIAGYTLSFGNGGYDFYLVKTDSIGKMLWQKTYGGSDWEFANGLQITEEGNYLLCGKTYSDTYGGSDILLVCTNSNGDQLWSKKYGGSQDEDAKGIIKTSDNNFIIAGETASQGNGNGDGYILKIKANGDTIFTKTFGGAKYDKFEGIDKAKNGDFLIVGSSESYSAKGSDTYILRMDSTGNEVWHVSYAAGDASLGMDEIGYKIKELPSEEILTVGVSYSIDKNGNAGMHILRISKNGYWLAGPVFGYSEDDKGYALTLTKSNAVVYAGYTKSYGVGKEDVYMVKIKNSAIVMEYILDIKVVRDNLATLSVKDKPIQLPENSVTVAPNPFSNLAEIYFGESLFNAVFSFYIYDILGKQIFYINDVQKKQYHLNAQNFSKGFYVYKVISNGVVITQGKLVVN